MSFFRNISPSNTSDSELLNLFRTDANIKVLGDLYQRYIDMAYAVCLKYLKDPELSKDAVMDIFEELSDKLLRHDVTNFRSWLYTVVKNHCLMQLRSSSSGKLIALDENSMQSEDKMHQEDVQEKEWRFERLATCIETLSSEQKQTVELFYLQEKCYKEIVELTGLEWNKVRSLIQNGRRNLKICMESAEEKGLKTNLKSGTDE